MNHIIPGVLIPAFISTIGMVFYWNDLLKYRAAIIWCAVFAVPIVLWQGYVGWEDGALHLPPFFLIYLALHYLQSGMTARPIVAFSGTWLSIVAVDILGSYTEAGFHNGGYMTRNILWPLELVGGDGWHDSLLMYPVFSVILVTTILPIWGRAKKSRIYQRMFRYGKDKMY